VMSEFCSVEFDPTILGITSALSEARSISQY
jgi:hypothetical protein